MLTTGCFYKPFYLLFSTFIFLLSPHQKMYLLFYPNVFKLTIFFLQKVHRIRILVSENISNVLLSWCTKLKILFISIFEILSNIRFLYTKYNACIFCPFISFLFPNDRFRGKCYEKRTFAAIILFITFQ